MILYSIHELQKDCDRLIQKRYPYLSIIIHPKQDVFTIQSKLNVWKRKHPTLTLDNIGVYDTRQVENFVNDAAVLWGVEVIVLRRMKNAWLPIRHTGHLNFEQQNNIGLEMAIAEVY